MSTAWDAPQSVGVLREVKPYEQRVALTPAGVAALVGDGRHVVVESGAGVGSGYGDQEYKDAGAIIALTPAQVAEAATLLLHVKEPQISEFDLFRADHTLFTYLHLAAAPDVATALQRSGCRAIAYESVEVDHHLPLLAPMSAVAGRLATQIGAHLLEVRHGGRGILLGGVPGVEPASVVVIGAGVAGHHAALVAAGMGAEVTIVDLNEERARDVANSCGSGARALGARPGLIDELAPSAAILIGSVLSPGHKAPKVITSRTLELMPEGSVVIDIAIDQGGCVEGVQPTTHAEPARLMGHVLVSATPNMPAAVPRTSTSALTAATLPYVRALASGWTSALETRPELAGAVNIEAGSIVHDAIRDELVQRHG